LAGAWFVDAVVLRPTLSWLAEVERETTKANDEIQESQALLDRQARIMSDWRARHASGLLADEGAVRFRGQDVLAQSAKQSGFVIDSVGGGQLVNASHDSAYDTIRVTISGQSSLSQAQAFIKGLELSDMPLRIERCEFSASDPRKDVLDVAIIISTRLASDAGRSTRSVPDGTQAWKPEVQAHTLDAEIVAARPFLSDRSRPAPVTPVTPVTREVVSVKGWALVGVVVAATEQTAFLRSLDDGSERLLHVGDSIDGGTVEAIAASGIRLAQAEQARDIHIGQDLQGNSAGAGPMRSGPPASTSSSSSSPAKTPGASPFQVPQVSPDPERDAILERLRQQRNRN
jgi:hypothetical protein